MKFLTLVGLTLVAANSSEVTPVQKVIELLNGMLAKGKEEKHAEQVQFAAYKQFCDDTQTEKTRAIAEADQLIEKLTADITKYASDAAKLGKEVQEHDTNIATFEGDQKAATKVRDLERADYLTTHKDYSESVDALQRAITVLKQQSHDRKQAATMLAQLDALIPVESKSVVTAFLATDNEITGDNFNPEANAYEFQSGGVIDMLEKLLDKFVDERTDLEKAEMNSKHAHDMLMQDLTAQIAHNTKARTEKATLKAKKLQAKADAEGDRTDTQATRDADAKYLKDLVATCQQKASDFEQRQQLRADELQALSQAIEILGSDKVTGNSEKYLPQFIQKPAFIQLKNQVRSHEDNIDNAAGYLRRSGEKLQSRILSQIAMQMTTATSTQVGADVFAKVKKLIQDLITRLMEEANAEADQKGWCDAELATNEATRTEKTAKVEQLHSEIDQLTASIAKLKEEIADLQTQIGELTAAMAKATELRNAEKKKNTQTIKDAGEAQTAVAQALTVLKEFYAKAGDATALLQQPAIFDSPYKGMQAENGGVVGMLEVIESDFARLEAETSASESQAQSEYDEFMADSSTTKAVNEKDVEHKTTKKQNEEQALSEKKGDLDGTQKELDAALAYFDKLKPTCIDSGVSYEERVARRKEEIESLQEALKILSGEQ